MNSCKRIFYNKKCFARMLFRRMKSSYIVETRYGIYQIGRKSDTLQKSSSIEQTPYIFNKNIIEFYTLPEKQSVISNLIKLCEIENQLKIQDIDYLNGYIHKNDGDNIERSLVFIRNSGDNNSRTTSILNDYEMNKTVFHWNETHLQKKIQNGIQVTQKEQFEINQYLGVHPILSSKEQCPVYETYEQVTRVLRKLSELNISPEITEFGNRKIEDLPNIRKKLKNPFIVVEGLDGTGKSTMVKNLSNRLNAVSMATPSDTIRHIRVEFDKLPEICRRSFYAFSNYLASCDASHRTDENTVVLDRYWHSTTSYAMAKVACHGTTEHLVHPDSKTYDWPVDLLKPSAVVFLTTPEKDRDARVNDRNETTIEEIQIAENKKLRQRITECYRRIGLTNWIEVDTSGSQEESLQKAVNGLKEKNIIP